MRTEAFISMMLALAVPLAAQAAPTTADYLVKAGQSDRFEIQSGKLARAQGGDAIVRRLGARMVRDHTRSTKLILAAARKSHVHPDDAPELDADQRTMLNNLAGKRGADFDKAYLADQALAHLKALDLQQSYFDGGQDPDLRSAAGKIIPVVQNHIRMLKKMRG